MHRSVQQADDKQVVIFIAPPGSGKGTQADLLAEKLGFFHLESSKVIEDKFISDPENSDVKLAKQQWLTGILVEPKLVSVWISERIGQLASENKSIIFSGSPRTLFEAEQLVPILESLYSKDGIKIFHISLSENESINRNSNRRICKAQRHSIPNTPEFKDLTSCPKDGSEIIRRALDKPEVIRKRLVEYKNRTLPIMEYFKNHDYKITEINGEQDIEKVSQDILSYFFNADKN